MSSKTVLQECQVRSVKEKRLTKVSRKRVKSERPTKVSSKSIPQECLK